MIANLLGGITVLHHGTEEMKFCGDCGEDYPPEDREDHEPPCAGCASDSHSACRCPEFDWVRTHRTETSDDGGGKAYGARDCYG